MLFPGSVVPLSDAMLLSLTCNPAIDRVQIVPGFRHAESVRVLESRDTAGGKGLNVTRTAQTLGARVRACGPLAGDAGRHIAALAAAEGFDAAWYWMQSGESRTCVLVTDPAASDSLAINEVGPLMNRADWDGLADLVRGECAAATVLVVSGSLMPGVDPVWLAGLLHDVQTRLPVFLDTSGAALQAGLELPLDLLKVNGHELGAALGTVITTPAEAMRAAHTVRARGMRRVIVTLGRLGAVALDESGAWLVRAPEVPLVSPIGSGDALMAGVAVALMRGEPLPEALRLGVACGASNAAHAGAGVVVPAEVERLRRVVSAEMLDT